MSIFVISKMSEVLDAPYKKDWQDNLKILLWENFELIADTKDYLQLNDIISQLQYNLQSPQYDWKIDEIKKLSVENLRKENRYFPNCSLQHAIEILQTLDLYKSK